MVRVGGTDVDSGFLDRMQSLMRPEKMSYSEVLDKLVPSAIRGKHKIKWGMDDKGRQRYKEVDGVSISSGTMRLADKLAEVKDVDDKINKLSAIDDLYDLSTIRTDINNLPIHIDTLSRKLDDTSNNIVTSEVEKSLLGEASKEILGREINRAEYRELWETDRSSSTKIAIRMKSLR